MKKLIYNQEDLDLILSLKTQEDEDEINNLQSKIDKAIEYIKIQQKIFKDYDIVSENQLNNLLDILKGE